MIKSLIKSLSYQLRGKYQPGGFPAEFYSRYYTEHAPCHIAKNGVVFMCDGRLPHGGLSDRLKGCLSAYKMAHLMGNKFYINWVSPYVLTDYLVPNEIDWTISADELVYDSDKSFPAFVMWNTNDRKMPKTFDTMKFVAFMSKRKSQIHVYSNTMLLSKGGLSKLYAKLFKPSEKLSSALLPHLCELGKGYESYSFRFLNLLGDFEDTISSKLDEKSADILIKDCGSKLLDMISAQPDGTRALVASDSMRFLEYAANLDERVYIIPGKIAHSDKISSGVDSDDESDIWLKTFVDQHMIMHAEKVHLLRTGKMYNSGFPAFAAAVGGRPYIIHNF